MSSGSGSAGWKKKKGVPEEAAEYIKGRSADLPSQRSTPAVGATLNGAVVASEGCRKVPEAWRRFRKSKGGSMTCMGARKRRGGCRYLSLFEIDGILLLCSVGRACEILRVADLSHLPDTGVQYSGAGCETPTAAV